MANFTRKNRQHLTTEELTATEAQVEQVRAALAGTERDPILKAMDELDELTQPYAERVMNISIQQAMAGKKIS
ncbi:hypothetical protein ACFQT0_08485 [Hymenobacter humi]|uniref:Uncharacterized protein n=1 Tax=Hymenobacter humi TaxID=1411620 RepID=A0ABW2U1U0_9BACT